LFVVQEIELIEKKTTATVMTLIIDFWGI